MTSGLLKKIVIGTGLLVMQAANADSTATKPEDTSAPILSWTVLGSNAGPVASVERAEPANLLQYGDASILVDAGDGVTRQLANTGIRLEDVQTILVSHLHSDHTGGLFAIISMRYHTRSATPITIYGPPGTKAMVEKLFEANKPSARVLQAGGWPQEAPYEWSVIELKGGDTFDIGPIAVQAVENSHYSGAHAVDGELPLSLSLRFDAGEHSIFYTGDTGPSKNIERACRGTTILVAETMDPAAMLKRSAQEFGDTIAPAFLKKLEQHYSAHHLSPSEVGELAARCDAKSVVVTHNSLLSHELAAGMQAIKSHYQGPAFFANDLDRFSADK